MIVGHAFKALRIDYRNIGQVGTPYVMQSQLYRTSGGKYPTVRSPRVRT